MLYKNSFFIRSKSGWGQLFLLMALIVLLPLGRAEAETSLTVLPFKNLAGSQEAASLLTGQLMADLSADANICLVDRSNMKDILDEQGLGKTGVIAKHTIAPMGKVQGVDYLLTGSIFRPQNVAPKKGVKYPATRFDVSWKLIDTTTGQIILASTNSKEIAKISIKKDGKRLWVTPSDAAGNALTSIASDISQMIQQKMAHHIDIMHVAFVDGDVVYLDGGQNKNIDVDEVFSIVQDGIVIRDPETGKFLGHQQKILCKIKIESVDDGFSFGKVISGSSKDLQIGNVAIASCK